MMKKILLISFLFSSVIGFSQSDTTGVVVRKDPRIDMLIKKQTEINEVATRNARSTATGFRIQVISTNNRAKALEAKTKVYQQFPELKAYLLYQSPNYRLRVGNFKDRMEAETYLESIKSIFPTGIYIVNDRIEVNPAKSLEQE
jgi:hypothetical protein